jgi:hypothetical protein
MISFASQDLGVRFWAMLSSVFLSVLGLVAGGMLIFMGHLVVDLDIATPRLFQILSLLGLTPIALAWLLYMGMIAIVFGYRRTSLGDCVLVLLFVGACSYDLIVIIASVLVMPHGHSVM